MAKRTATTELNYDNWDKQEEEPEEVGEFRTARDDVLKQRTIKKAKRRVVGEGGGSGTFAGFTGFAAKAPSTPNFGFLSGASQSTTTNGSSSNGVVQTTNAPSMFSGQPKEQTPSRGDSEQEGYNSMLKALNESVLAWIKQHVETNAYCVLSPVFTDYEKHLSDLKRKYPHAADTPGKTVAVPKVSAIPPSNTSSLMTSSFNTSTAAATSSLNMFSSFGTSSNVLSSTTKSITGFGNSPLASTTASMPAIPAFSSSTTSSFPSFNKPFSFAVSKPPDAPSASEGGEKEEDEYEPPKNEFTPVVEDGSLYTTRCKLFYKGGGSFAEKGTGNLYIKSAEGKTTLLVRADTNLGNILLNVRLVTEMVMQRMGKNNVSLMCVPNPPIDPKGDNNTPVLFLIRVKTGEDADQLLEQLNKHKN